MLNLRGNLVKPVLGLLLSPLPTPVDPSHAGPGLHLGWRLGWLKGLLVRAGLARRGGRFQCGRRLVVQGRLRVRGPGRVILGDDIIIGDNTDIYTHSPASVVTIGDRTFLNGTRFGCSRSITVGPESILADARIMDTDFHAVGRDRRCKGVPAAKAPVVIGANVWIAAGSFVMKGVTIGDNSLVAAASVVVRDVPADTIVGGNPARPLGPVPERSPRETGT